jgi:hypothetical protein
MTNQYAQPNTAERVHLEKVIARLSPSDHGRPAGGPGWTVGGLLAHLAFWDTRALVLLAMDRCVRCVTLSLPVSLRRWPSKRRRQSMKR